MSKKDTLLLICPGLLVLFFACYTFFARFYLYSDYDAEPSKSVIRTLESSQIDIPKDEVLKLVRAGAATAQLQHEAAVSAVDHLRFTGLCLAGCSVIQFGIVIHLRRKHDT